jgi:hypothetical protein
MGTGRPSTHFTATKSPNHSESWEYKGGHLEGLTRLALTFVFEPSRDNKKGLDVGVNHGEDF